MAYTPNDFGHVTRLEADAEGPPGRRTFRLLVANEEGSASLWLEKEELKALGVAIDQLLSRVLGRPVWRMYGTEVDPYQPAQGFPLSHHVEFKVGQLSLGYESDSRLFVLLIHNSEDDPEGPPTFTCLASTAQLRGLSRRIESVISAGRPVCPVCGDSKEPEGHICVRLN